MSRRGGALLVGLFDRIKITIFTTGDKAFGDGFKFFPAGANLLGFRRRDFLIGGGGGDGMQQIGKFLDDLVGGRDQVVGVRRVFRVEDEKTAGALAKPLDEPLVAGAAEKGVHAVQRVAGATAGGVVGRLRPFVNHGQGKAKIGGHLFGCGFLEDFAEQLMRLHSATMGKSGEIGK